MVNLSPELIKEINKKVALTHNFATLTKSLKSIEDILLCLKEKNEFGIPQYRSVEEQAGKLLLEFQNSQPFMSFNEETGILSAIYLLKANNKFVLYNPEDIQFLYRGMKVKIFDLESMIDWCTEHVKMSKEKTQLK